MDTREFAAAKQELRSRLRKLADELDRYLVGEYGVYPVKTRAYDQWRQSHQPFHWFAEFYGIMWRGGFDVIIGNPPYIEYSKVNDTYTVINYITAETNNLYAFVSERARILLQDGGRVGLILPNSSISADKMQVLCQTLRKHSICWISNFAWRPSKLFEGANMLLAIWLLHNAIGGGKACYSTRYNRWKGEFRDFLFDTLIYTNVSDTPMVSRISKPPGLIFHSIFKKCLDRSNGKNLLSLLNSKNGRYSLYYFRAVLYWFKVLTKQPVFREDGLDKRTGEMKEIMFSDQKTRDIVVALLSSNLYNLYYTVWSSCQVVNSSDFCFPADIPLIVKEGGNGLAKLSQNLVKDYQANSIIQERHYSSRGRNFVMHKQYFFLKKSKYIIDEIDCILAKHYAFTDEELDFIINYDIKYRMGQEDGSDDE